MGLTMAEAVVAANELQHSFFSIQSKSMGPKRILVVDDNPVILKALSFKLNAAGFEPVTAEDGAEAVSAVRTQAPDLILVDISFPPDVANGGGVPWDGFLIIDWLRRFGEATAIPFIVITGGHTTGCEERARAAGAVGLFYKPLDYAELIGAIHQALEVKAAA
jgi:CheY-like chemotaxis protein